MSRTDNSFKNIKFALIFQMATAIVSFFTRKVFVLFLTKEYLGLNGTFSNILSMLSLAELGVGTAITYSLYKPLAEGDQGQVAAIMALYRRVYRVIGIVVAVLGIALMPFLPVLIRELPDIPHLNLIYLLFVLNSALSYFYAYKQSLIIADQRQYIVTAWQNGLDMALVTAQAFFLVLTRNYFVYLGLQIGINLLKNIILSRQADRYYPFLMTAPNESLDNSTKQDIVRNVKALFTHNLGGIVVFGTDNLLIAHFIGMVAVGFYSNYLMVVGSLRTVYDQLFRSITASVGNLGASENPQRVLSVFWKMNFFGGWLFGFSSVCLAVLLNPFITLWVGTEYLLSQEVVWLIALNFYVWGMRKAVLVFRNAYGLYWYDRYKPVAECVVNLVASIVLADRFGVAGIMAGTVISTMTTCFWVEPMLLFKYAFHTSPIRFFRDYAINTAIVFLTFGVVWAVCAILPTAGLSVFIAKMALCAVLGNAGFLIAYCRRKEFWYFVRLILDRLNLTNHNIGCLKKDRNSGSDNYKEGLFVRTDCREDSLKKMELFSEKKRCCGCMACADICPNNAIAFKVDSEGFWYPEIKRELCINCGRCKTVCPLASGKSGKEPNRYIIAQAKDPELRKTSTSGAVFPVLAQAVLNQGGVVYGAGFDSSMQVVHQKIVSYSELDCLMQTKYVQSKTEGIFRCVRDDLQDGRQVLFVGTPCQAEALRRFLGKEYPTLILADLICYGVPSPGVWSHYTAYLEKKYCGKLTRFRFRDKRGCDNGHTVSFRIRDQEYVEEEYGRDPFLALYFSNYIIRPSCHACPFTTVERGSDITIGDFWGIEKVAPEMDDGMGTSLVMLRSERGEALWESLRDQFRQIACGREDAMQPRLVSPTLPASMRRLFFALYRILPFSVFTWKEKLRRVLHGGK